MIDLKWGRIINIGSVIANTGNIGQTNYSAAKAAVNGFSKSLAKELAINNITVNVVSPGFISTGINKNLKSSVKQNILKNIPINRFGRSSDIANFVIFLSSNKASYITGENININGGLLMK